MGLRRRQDHFAEFISGVNMFEMQGCQEQEAKMRGSLLLLSPVCKMAGGSQFAPCEEKPSIETFALTSEMGFFKKKS